MEDLLNTFSFQCWNEVAFCCGQAEMAAEFVISRRERKNNTLLTLI